jgi:hypothetical protein
MTDIKKNCKLAGQDSEIVCSFPLLQETTLKICNRLTSFQTTMVKKWVSTLLG